MGSESLRNLVETSRGRLTVVLSDRSCTMLIRRLTPGEALPECRHVRSDVVIQVIAGTAELDRGSPERPRRSRKGGSHGTPAAAPEVLFIACGEPYVLGNPGADQLVLLTLICPGVTTLDSKPYGSLRCPVCSAEVAVEEGDVPGDRVICPDCTVWMRIVEAERGYTAELAG